MGDKKWMTENVWHKLIRPKYDETHDRKVTERRVLAFHKNTKFHDQMRAAEEDVLWWYLTDCSSRLFGRSIGQQYGQL